MDQNLARLRDENGRTHVTGWPGYLSAILVSVGELETVANHLIHLWGLANMRGRTWCVHIRGPGVAESGHRCPETGDRVNVDKPLGWPPLPAPQVREDLGRAIHRLEGILNAEPTQQAQALPEARGQRQREDTLYDVLCSPGAVIRVADVVLQTLKDLKAAKTVEDVRKCLDLWRGHIALGYMGDLARFAEANGIDSTGLFRATQKQSAENFMQAEVVVQRIISACGRRLLREVPCGGADNAAGTDKELQGADSARLLPESTHLREMPGADQIEMTPADGPSQWAKLFGISVSTFMRRLKDGTIRHKKLSSKNYQIAITDLPAKHQAKFRNTGDQPAK